MGAWTAFFQGELGAAAALAGLLFVAVSMNQQRILSLGRMADRGLETLSLLFLLIVITSLGLLPGQPVRLFGAEIAAAAGLGFVAVVAFQRAYLRHLDPDHLRRSRRMVMISRAAVAVLVASGVWVLWRGDTTGLYLTCAGVLLSFFSVGANAWVLLIEINR